MAETNQPIAIGSSAGKDATCASCSKTGKAADFFTYAGKDGVETHLCHACRDAANAQFDAETKNPNVPLAAAVGLLAGAVAGAGWFFITILTKYEIGYISIALGAFVGLGVVRGAGGKRGHGLQVLSAAVAVVSILATELFIMNYLVRAALEAKGYGVLPFFVVTPFDPEFWSELVSPIGLVIYAIGIIAAYRAPAPRKI